MNNCRVFELLARRQLFRLDMSNGFHALVSVTVFAAMVSWAGIPTAVSAGDPKLSASAESPATGRNILLRSGNSDHELYRVSLSSVGALPPLNTMMVSV